MIPISGVPADMTEPAHGSRAITVAPTRDHLLVDDKPWFLLADTIWSAFNHVPEHDWRPYLEHRRAQGFNALLISALPILHDMSGMGGGTVEPFAGFWNGQPRFGALTDPYREVIRARVDSAREFGFTPVVVDVWCNYAPDTWASRGRPEYVIPSNHLREYLVSLIDAVGHDGVVHLVSGDADFEKETAVAFYADALRCVKELAPTCLTGMHLQPEAILPSPLADADELDLYVYQSGHHIELQHLPYTLAESYRGRPTRRPIMNLEPPYEGHGHGFRYGRFDAFDVRRASWQSILAGASAGLGYGAHGVWQWHQRGDEFNHAAFSGQPFDHASALSLDGANDVGFLNHLVKTLGLVGVSPSPELVLGGPAEVRAATTADARLTAVYAPAPIDLTLAVADAVAVERWNLRTRDLELVAAANADALFVPMPSWLADSLTLIHRAGHR